MTKPVTAAAASMLMIVGCIKPKSEAAKAEPTPRYEIVEHDGMFNLRDNLLPWISKDLTCDQARQLLAEFTKPLNFDPVDNRLKYTNSLNWRVTDCDAISEEHSTPTNTYAINVTNVPKPKYYAQFMSYGSNMVTIDYDRSAITIFTDIAPAVTKFMMTDAEVVRVSFSTNTAWSRLKEMPNILCAITNRVMIVATKTATNEVMLERIGVRCDDKAETAEIWEQLILRPK